MKLKLQNTLRTFSFPIKDLLYAVRNIIGAVIPLFVGMAIGEIEIGVKCTLGASFVFGVDREEPLNSKLRILIITTLLVTTLTALMLYIAPYFYFKLSIILIIIFALAYISSLGYRYALMAFMGYLAILISISMTASNPIYPNIPYHVFWVFIGSVWYILFGSIFHLIQGKKPLIRKLDVVVSKTAELMELRSQLMQVPSQDTEKDAWKLSELRLQVTDLHADLRDVLLADIGSLRRKNSIERQIMLGFVELVDMFEMVVGTPIDYEAWHKFLNEDKDFEKVPEVTLLMVKVLQKTIDKKTRVEVPQIIEQIEKLQADIKSHLLERNEVLSAVNDDTYQKVRRIQIYQKHQLDRIKNIFYIYNDELEKIETKVSDQSFQKFKNSHPLNRTTLLNNLTFQSSTFRYALRTAITAVAGYLMAYLLNLENSYWVMLTVLVIMKPGYSVTKNRFYHRIIGTLIGALIAVIFIWIGVGTYFLIALLAISLILGFSYMNTNYVIASAFFTLFIFGLYGILAQPLPEIIFYRLVDTALGGVLCFLSIQFLFPFWEEKNIGAFITASQVSSRNYLKAITKEIENKSFNLEKYRLARKEAFVDLSNLIASYKRLKTDPQKRQMNADTYAEVIMLNEAILSSISSLAIGIQRYKKHLTNRGDILQHCKEVSSYYDNLIHGLEIESPISLLSDEIMLREKAEEELKNGVKGKNYLQYFHGKFVHEQLIFIEKLIRQTARMR